jgi:predicted RNA-binding protein with RPS1 domain
LPGEIDGMVHLSDLDWSRSGEEAVKDHTKGNMLKVKILDVDVAKERISLGVKQLTDDPFGASLDTLKKGVIVTCTVHQVADGGIEVLVGGEGGSIGFIRKAELSRDRSEQRPDRFAVGEKLDAKITTIDKKNRKISLSIKQREIEEEKQAMASYGSSDSGASLGDILGAAISEAAEEVAEETPEEAASKAQGEADAADAAAGDQVETEAAEDAAEVEAAAEEEPADEAPAEESEADSEPEDGEAPAQEVAQAAADEEPEADSAEAETGEAKDAKAPDGKAGAAKKRKTKKAKKEA